MKKEDMGEYSAYISNVAGSAYSSARLIVLSMYANAKQVAYAKRAQDTVFYIFFRLKAVKMFTDSVTTVFCNRSRGDYATR